MNWYRLLFREGASPHSFLQGEAMAEMTSSEANCRLKGIQGEGSRVGTWIQFQYLIEGSGQRRS